MRRAEKTDMVLREVAGARNILLCTSTVRSRGTLGAARWTGVPEIVCSLVVKVKDTAVPTPTVLVRVISPL